MADAAAARREARRRKILENSQNRLQIISGKSDDVCDDCVKESLIRTVSPEPEYDFPATLSTTSASSSSSVQNGTPFNQSDLLNQLLSRSRDASGSGDGERRVSDLASLLQPLISTTNGLLPPTTEPGEGAPTSLWESIVSHKYDIVLLSLFLQILYALSLLKFDNGYFFMPVIVYIVTKLILSPAQTSSGLANTLMLLNGMTPATVQRILFWTQLSGTVIRDIFVYLFTTIIFQSLLNMFTDSVVT